MPKFNECDLRRFSTGGRCIIETESDDPAVRGFWFGEIVCMYVVIDALGAAPAEVTARIKGGRLNAMGILSTDRSADGIPTCEYIVYPYDDTLAEVLSRLDSLRANSENEISSLRASLDRKKKEIRGMEQMHVKTFCQLMDTQDKLKAVERSSTVPSHPIIQVTKDEAPRRETSRMPAVRRSADGPGRYSIVNRPSQ